MKPRNYSIIFKTSVAVFMLSFWTSSCAYLPNLLENSDEFNKRETQRAEEAVKNSPELQELERVCGDLTSVRKFEVVKKSARTINRLGLYYYYHTGTDPNNFKGVDKLDLEEKGWKKIREEDSVEAYSIKYQKDDYTLVIYYGGGGKSNYATACIRE